ncbi:chorismate synthase [Limisalsivibrio acetivorans]|uniref:chorismate synthase n=1 Tax=Limisalsivibrio acetivorans TaxID=1304888 RepID=UPI0003B3F527|nr:chorismate synthase [Limisalsivibrio acetivorans]
MAGSIFGEVFRISTFGESHGKSVGVVIDGCPAGIDIAESDIQNELNRRRPGQSDVSTPRDEKDKVEFHSGIFEGKTTGHPIMMLVYNENQRSKDYSKVKDLFRPGHADFTYTSKYGIRDYRGGGRSSARETIGRVCGGAVAKLLLDKIDLEVIGHVVQVGDIKAEKFDADYIEKNPVRCADSDIAQKMRELILNVSSEGDSIGAVVEVVISGVPVGLGEPVFDRAEAELAKGILSIPAVKGIEFGTGFSAATMRGSQNNDEMSKYGFLSNNAGGTLGGITTGQNIVFRFPVKPASSITVPKQTVDLYGNEKEIITEGRHDACVAPRVVPVAEAMSRLVLIDLLMRDTAARKLF